ncbi:MAG TPA: ScpA family protein [Candidatus Paceibacterota bacterium]|nr:ScpA family protein [Candidatus Paceibacterota bacterium]
MENRFTIKAGEFEGPLELLLDLIEKRKLHISQVSLAQVADEYIIHVQRLGQVPMGDMANFVLVASTLMLIKSLSLLPTLQLTQEEKQSVEDLERRLKLYEKMRELSVHIKERFGKQILYNRQPSKERPIVFAPAKDATAASLHEGIKRVLASLPKREAIPQAIVRKVISLEEVVENLADRVQRAFKLRFSEFAGQYKEERVNVIVSFLGMLELVKQGIINVTQDSHFQDIAMETTKPGVPRY